MFERYTQDALGAVFYARAEAGIRGAPTIEVDHLLAGVLSQPSAVLPADGVRLLLQHLHGSEPRPSIAFSGVDLPVSESGALVFSYAEQAARGLGSSEIRLEHLLLGILRQNQRVRALFDEHGIDADFLLRALKR